MSFMDISTPIQGEMLSNLIRLSSEFSKSRASETLSKFIPHMSSLMCSDTTLFSNYHSHNNTATCIFNSNEEFSLPKPTYSLEGTPCNDVIRSKDTFLYDDRVQTIYSEDKWLKEYAVRGYIGAPIFDLSGEPEAIVFCLYKDGIINPEKTRERFHFLTSLISEMLQKDLMRQRLLRSETKTFKTTHGSVLCQAEIKKDGKILSSNNTWKAHTSLTEYRNKEPYLASNLLGGGGIPIYQKTELHDKFFNQEIPYTEILHPNGHMSNTLSVSAIGHTDTNKHNEINSLFQIMDTTRETEQYCRAALTQEIINATNEAITITDSEGNITNVNPAFEHITGYSEKEVLGKNPRILQSGKQSPEFYKEMWNQVLTHGHWEGDLWNKKKNGTIYLEHILIKKLSYHQGKTTHFLAIFQDQTLKNKMKEKINHLEYNDVATGYPNKYSTLKKIDQLLKKEERFSILLLRHYMNELEPDSKTPKKIHLLKSILKIINTAHDSEAFLGVIAPVEFMIIIPNIKIDRLSLILTRIAKILRQDTSPPPKDSGIGVIVSNKLLNNASEYTNLARAAAKKSCTHNTNRTKILDIMEIRGIQDRAKLESDLHAAIINGEIYAAYEPLINLSTNKVIGAEALARWEHPTQGMISPMVFLPIAAESGLFNKLTQKLLNDSCIAMRRWLDHGFKLDRLSVNVSTQQIDLDYLPKLIESILSKSKLAPKYLQIEITEESLIDKLQAPEVLNKIRNMGVRVAIDDFGSGYSSLAYLKDLPVNTLKIDKSFTLNAAHCTKDVAIISSIISLAKNLGLEVIAEGVENEKLRDILTELRCDFSQGYYYSKAKKAPQFKIFLETYDQTS